jgi:NAD(P)H dehydrogenase (quinone)
VTRRTLVVVCHPNPASLTRAALARVLAGLERAGDDVELIDLDAEGFDPRLSRDERRRHGGPPEDRPEVADHVRLLRWADRLVLVHPTWFGGQPARLKGWFDRTWINGVAYELRPGSSRIHGRLRNVRELHVVTSHGSGPLQNWFEGNGGRVLVFRTLRLLCHPRTRCRWTALYGVDRRSPDELTAWLDRVEAVFAGEQPARRRWW